MIKETSFSTESKQKKKNKKHKDSQGRTVVSGGDEGMGVAEEIQFTEITLYVYFTTP